jgi:hypothetical protein
MRVELTEYGGKPCAARKEFTASITSEAPSENGNVGGRAATPADGGNTAIRNKMAPHTAQWDRILICENYNRSKTGSSKNWEGVEPESECLAHKRLKAYVQQIAVCRVENTA